MEIFATCMECQKELNQPPLEELCFVPYYDDRIAEVHCSRGQVVASELSRARQQAVIRGFRYATCIHETLY